MISLNGLGLAQGSSTPSRRANERAARLSVARVTGTGAALTTGEQLSLHTMESQQEVSVDPICTFLDRPLAYLHQGSSGRDASDHDR